MALNTLLNQSILLENPTGTRDLHGKRGLAASQSIRARFERTYKTIVTETREKEPIHGVVFVPPDTDVEIGARVTYQGVHFRVVSRMDQVGRSGALNHKELFVQLWSF